MMVASRILAGARGAEFREDAVRCLWRARELVGVLEIMDLPESIGQELAPYYTECSLKSMFSEERLTREAIEEFGGRLGEMFDHVAQELAHA